MTASSSSAQLQTPIEQKQVHYIADGVFTLGTLSCAVCGQAFPIQTSATQRCSCAVCGTLHEPSIGLQRGARVTRGGAPNGAVCSVETSAARLFTSAEVALAMAHMQRTLREMQGEADADGAGAFGTAHAVTKRAGRMEVDNRVIEEAFCETCAVHRPCKTFARQTRSADEGQTIFFQCTKCGSEWQQNS